MCKPDSGFSPDAEDEELRFVSQGCCIFYPELPNFLVGQVLAQTPEDELRPKASQPAPHAGEAIDQALGVIRSRIRGRAGCTPFGILPPASVEQIQTDPFRTVFGSEESLFCPYMQVSTRACTIWSQRNAVCSTWFCKFERGAFSSQAWDAVKALLRGVETSLSLWCVHHLVPDDEAIALLFDAGGAPRRDVLRQMSAGLEDDGLVPDSVVRRLWGVWYSREEDFFRACAQRVGELGWEDVRRIGGERIAVLERLVSRALSRLAHSDIPARLRPANLPGSLFQIRPTADGRAAVYVNAINYDVQNFETKLLEQLDAFDGRSDVAKIREDLEDSGVTLGDETLRRLVDYGLLVSADPETAEPGERLPVHPGDRLRVVAAEFASQVDFDAQGAAVVRMRCGFKSVEFDEAELLEFGRQLARHRWGFTAGQCTGWNTGPDPLTWERVAALLDALITEGVLEQVEPDGKASAERSD